MTDSRHALDTAALLRRLDDWGIDYQLVEHAPVLTIAESAALDIDLPAGARCKNLLLRDKKKRLYMVVAPADLGPIDLVGLRAWLGSGRLSFAPADTLHDLLSLPPGGTSPLALVNDHDHVITLVMAKALEDEPTFLFHPLTNAATLAISREGLDAFLAHIGVAAQWVPVPEKPADDGPAA